MESKQKETVTSIPNENDIPGASLCGRDPRLWKIPELKQWLLYRMHLPMERILILCCSTPIKVK